MSAINQPPAGMTLTELGLDDPAALVAYAEVLAGEYLTTPPMGFLT